MGAPADDGVVARAAAVLRALGAVRSGGASTSDVARATGIPRASVHRLLTSLAREGMADRTPTGSWLLGPEVFLLGATASARYDMTSQAVDVLEGLVRATGESAFLSARRGRESVCLAAEEGSFPLRSHVLYPGVRFPLGVASAGLAILSHLSREECAEYLDDVDLEADYGPDHSVAALRRRISRTRREGYAVNPGLVVHGSWGIGAAVFDRNGRPGWALSLTGVQTRFTPGRVPELGDHLLRAAHTLTRRARQRGVVL